MRGAPGGARLREAEGTFSLRFFPVHDNVLFLHFGNVLLLHFPLTGFFPVQYNFVYHQGGKPWRNMVGGKA